MLLHPKIRHYLFKKLELSSQCLIWSFYKTPIVCQDHLLIVHRSVEFYMHVVSVFLKTTNDWLTFSCKAVSVVVTWGLFSNYNKRFNLVLSFICRLPHLGTQFCNNSTNCTSSDWRSLKMNFVEQSTHFFIASKSITIIYHRQDF